MTLLIGCCSDIREDMCTKIGIAQAVMRDIVKAETYHLYILDIAKSFPACSSYLYFQNR